ncbi:MULTISPECIES: hypothetical protein [unclassified Halomonas]|uniref:hypothetical protein n=1 Tax=unclassified Halomonas TaxID=2609666 RepID=UPI00047F3981|nr:MULTISPECIES: hypothetical protein [unclassified Halomonas]PKH59404.1 hypothetical protein CXF94_17050 [Halomonas sp. Choline-3u-9]QGQ70645.1 hypothetical protein FDY98_12715 [Halomonas sp. PA16-9]
MTQPFDWINKSNNDQLAWIASYMGRKAIAGSSLFTLVKNHNQFGYQEMAKSLNLLPDNAEYREASRQMKSAWQTRQHRKKHGNPVSLQMPKESLKKLNALAKNHGQSQGNTLSQIINDAINDQKRDTAQARGDREKLRAQLNKQHEKAQQIEHDYMTVVNSLMNTLAEELSYRCRLEAFVGGWDDSPLESNDKQTYHDLVEKRVSHAELNTSKLKSLNCYAFPTLRMRMREQAIINGIEESDTGLL